MTLKEFITEASSEISDKEKLNSLPKKIRDLEKKIKEIEDKEDITKLEKATLRMHKETKDALEKEKAELASKIGKNKKK